jgi:outer membrane protein OmpA-like peptidoglycan-associated protein
MLNMKVRKLLKTTFTYFCLLLFLLIVCSEKSNSQTLIDLRKQLNPDTFKEWDEYIKAYAPSDSAFNVVLNLANRHIFSSRAAVARQVYIMYMDLFPSRKTWLNQQADVLEEIMLTQEIQKDMYGVFDDFVKSKAPERNAFVAVQRIAERYIDHRDWDSAATVFKYYKPLFPNMSRDFDKIIDILNAPYQGLVVRNLGNKINTSQDEWDPTPTPDGKYLYFSASNRNGGYGKSDVFYSQLINGDWSTPKNVGREVNGREDETVDNVSIDGNLLFLSGNFEGTFGNFDIYSVKKTESGWGQLFHYPQPINSEYTDEGANSTPDGKAIIFSSDRPGTIGDFTPYGNIKNGSTNGNMDIYVTVKTDSGWSQPINLGKTINTPYAERAPYLHPDGKTLYFSSEGHPGLGHLDLFKSVRLSDTSWTEWSEPVNLGKEINSAGEDWGYVVNLSGDSAFFAGLNRPDGYGGWDIYSISLPKSAKPQILVCVHGTVKTKDGIPLSASIKWEDLEAGKVLGVLESSPQDGSYIIALPLGKNYGFYAQRNGFYPSSYNLDLRNINSQSSITQDIVLYSTQQILKEKVGLVINNVFFDYNSFELKPESFPELDRLAEFIKSNTSMEIEISGHTDNIGSDEFNKKLSLKRAESVLNYLVSKGIKKNLMSVKGYGATIPLVPNTNDENRSKNRRVEIKYTK